MPATSSVSCSTVLRASCQLPLSRPWRWWPTSSRCRAQLSAIRGVNADGVLRLLVARGYVAEVGRDRGPGQAVLFGTTQGFLEKLGLDTLGDLPPLSGFVPSVDTVEMLERALRPETGT